MSPTIFLPVNELSSIIVRARAGVSSWISASTHFMCRLESGMMPIMHRLKQLGWISSQTESSQSRRLEVLRDIIGPPFPALNEKTENGLWHTFQPVQTASGYFIAQTMFATDWNHQEESEICKVDR